VTQLVRRPLDISNYFDELERGIGHRGSSFTDADRICWTHNGKGANRFLFRELKAEGEKELNAGQKWALEALAKVPRVTVWGGRHLGGDRILFRDFANGKQEVITGDTWKSRVHAWWEGEL
jgi:hypothetical protein